MNYAGDKKSIVRMNRRKYGKELRGPGPTALGLFY